MGLTLSLTLTLTLTITLTLTLTLTLTRCAGHAIVCAAGGAFDLNCTDNSQAASHPSDPESNVPGTL